MCVARSTSWPTRSSRSATRCRSSTSPETRVVSSGRWLASNRAIVVGDRVLKAGDAAGNPDGADEQHQKLSRAGGGHDSQNPVRRVEAWHDRLLRRTIGCCRATAVPRASVPRASHDCAVLTTRGAARSHSGTAKMARTRRELPQPAPSAGTYPAHLERRRRAMGLARGAAAPPASCAGACRVPPPGGTRSWTISIDGHSSRVRAGGLRDHDVRGGRRWWARPRRSSSPRPPGADARAFLGRRGRELADDVAKPRQAAVERARRARDQRGQARLRDRHGRAAMGESVNGATESGHSM